MFCKCVGLAAVGISACFVPRHARADVVNWTLGANGNWNVAANWTVAGQPANQHVPGSGDMAAIAHCSVSHTGNLYNVFGLNLSNAGMSNGTLNVSGTSVFANTNTLDGVVLNANGGGSGGGTIRFLSGANLNVASGQTLSLDNALLAFRHSAPANGGNVSGNVAFTSANGGSLSFDGAVGNSNLDVTYALGSGGVFSGRINGIGDSYEQYSGSNVTLNTAATFNLNNAGTTTLLGVSSGNSGVQTINNSGSINVSGGNSLMVNADSFTNSGTLSASDGSSMIVNSRSFTNSGSIRQDSGTLTINGTLTNTSSASLTMTNGSTLALVNGTLVDMSNTVALSNLSLSSSTLRNGALSVSGTSQFSGTNTLDGVVLNANGGGSGGGTIRFLSGANLNVASGQTLTLDNALLAFKNSSPLNGGNVSGNVAFTSANGGSLAFDGAAGNPNLIVTYALGSGGVFSGRVNGIGDSYEQHSGNNTTLNTSATFNLNTAGTVTILGATSGGVETVNNSGSINASGGNHLTVNATTFTNSGNVSIANGSSAIFTTGATQTAGKTVVDGTATINASRIFLVQGGKLEGNGTIAGAVNNTGGVVTAGSDTSAGHLTETGNYAQSAGGAYLLKLGGTGQGSSYDLFSVSGTASLGGQLQIQLLNTFTPFTGETFNFLTYGNHVGAFDSIFSTDTGHTYAVNYTGSGAVLVVGAAAVPETGTLVSLGLLMAGGAFALKRTRREKQTVG